MEFESDLGEHRMILVTPRSPAEIEVLLRAEVDEWPARWWYLPGHIRGTSAVCGWVDSTGFRLRNRSYPVYSSEAIGSFQPHSMGTAIHISFCEPLIAKPFEWLFPRRAIDHEVILHFVRQTLRITEPSGLANGGV